MRGRWGAAGLLLAALSLGSALFVRAALPQVQEEPFPHADHEGLFPLCTVSIRSC